MKAQKFRLKVFLSFIISGGSWREEVIKVTPVIFRKKYAFVLMKLIRMDLRVPIKIQKM